MYSSAYLQAMANRKVAAAASAESKAATLHQNGGGGGVPGQVVVPKRSLTMSPTAVEQTRPAKRQQTTAAAASQSSVSPHMMVSMREHVEEQLAAVQQTNAQRQQLHTLASLSRAGAAPTTAGLDAQTQQLLLLQHRQQRQQLEQMSALSTLQNFHAFPGASSAAIGLPHSMAGTASLASGIPGGSNLASSRWEREFQAISQRQFLEHQAAALQQQRRSPTSSPHLGALKTSTATGGREDPPAVGFEASEKAAASVAQAAATTMLQPFNMANVPPALAPAARGASTHHQERTVIPLSMAEDPNWLSSFQCYLREHVLEIFRASPDDIAVRNNSKILTPGQVGIRCKYCSHLPARARAPRSSAFPTSVHQIYQSFTMSKLVGWLVG